MFTKLTALLKSFPANMILIWQCSMDLITYTGCDVRSERVTPHQHDIRQLPWKLKEKVM